MGKDFYQIFGEMYDIFQKFGLLCFDGSKLYRREMMDDNKARTTDFRELKTVLETVCKIHELPLTITWVPCRACNDLRKVVEFCEPCRAFVEVSKCSHLREEDVVRMVLPKTEKIFFPILRDKHWMLLVIDVKKKCFLWLDSMRWPCRGSILYSENLANFLN